MNLKRTIVSAVVAACLSTSTAWAAAVFTIFEAAGANAASITPTRDDFRAAIGGGTTAGANGSFGGLRREINWDGVPDNRADPNTLPADFFNVNSPRGVVFSTPGTGFLVSANAGQLAPTLFGFGSDFATFSPQRLFTAVGSNITDVSFFLPGTTTAATTTAFGIIFTDVEVAGLTGIEFFDVNGDLIFARDALVSGNAGLSFLGATVTGGSIARVRIRSGQNVILANGSLGNPNDDVVVMDDFLYAEPLAQQQTVPLPSTLALAGLALAGMAGSRRRSQA